MPTASSSHAPALSTALAATMSWKPAGSTATQAPMPVRHVPPACRGVQEMIMGSGHVQGLVPSLGMGVTHPEPDGNVTSCGWGMLQPLVPSLGLVSPTPAG